MGKIHIHVHDNKVKDAEDGRITQYKGNACHAIGEAREYLGKIDAIAYQFLDDKKLSADAHKIRTELNSIFGRIQSLGK